MAPSNKLCTAALLLLLAVIIATVADAAKNIVSSEPVPKKIWPARQDASATCVGSLLALSPCLAFFENAGMSEAPQGCCEGLGGIIQDQAACLCHIFDHTLERAIGVDIPNDRALFLMDLCGLSPTLDGMDTCANGGEVPPLYVCPAPSA
ncbi:hypothetical protein ACQ4PT_038737 [Festuca glaucescens]